MCGQPAIGAATCSSGDGACTNAQLPRQQGSVVQTRRIDRVSAIETIRTSTIFVQSTKEDPQHVLRVERTMRKVMEYSRSCPIENGSVSSGEWSNAL